MSHGKEAARDLRYGRRGGRWGHDQADALAAIERARAKGIAEGAWPDGSPKGDRECRICERPIDQHGPPCPYCGRTPEHHANGDEAIEMAGRRRMAAARRSAGHPLDEWDRKALAS